jgi:DNA-binding GntR family transcriptional regulator
VRTNIVTARPPNPDGAIEPALSRLVLSEDGVAPTRGSMPDAVAGALREAILDGLLEPGSWLREAEVARELKVSRTPVRDAFRILAAEGLVNIKANQGAVVSPMTSDDILELYVMREALEALAARLAARRSPRKCLDEFSVLIPQMRKVGEAGDFRELSRLNFQFHAIVAAAAGNRYLERALTQVQNAARRFPDPTLGLPGRVAESIDEHVGLADAISQGDTATAERLAVEHMRHLSELRIRMLLHN